MLQMVKSSNKLLSMLNGEGKGVFHRVSGIGRKLSHSSYIHTYNVMHTMYITHTHTG